MNVARYALGFLVALGALSPPAALAAGDLVVSHVSRSPRLDYVWGSPHPEREGWPAPGQVVTWEAHVRSFLDQGAAGVGYRFFLDGAEVARGTLDLAPNATVTVGFPWPWRFERHELTFWIDPEGRVAEDEEGNNRLSVFTDALGVGFYVEQGFYDHFRANQRRLLGARSSSFEDWAQRHIRRFNEMAARAIYPETPLGVLDRMRIDEIVVVPDGALPLVPVDDLPQPDADGHTHPNLADRSVDMLWGFKTADLHAYQDLTTVDDTANNFYLQGALLHELGHARYLVDVYGWWVRDGLDGDRVDITEGGTRVSGSALMPSPPFLHFSTEAGLMNQSYGFIDRFSAIALNLIAGRRATSGNSNVPENRGVFLNDLPAENRVTIRDASGAPMPDADVWIYQGVGEQPVFFSRTYDDVPDLRLRTDAQGRVLVGRCPFSADGRLVHEFGASNVTAIVRVAKGSSVAYGFLESLRFNIAYWGGQRDLADHELVVGKRCSVNPPYLVSPKPDATVSASPVTLSWQPLFGASGFEVWAATDGGPARLLGTTAANRTSLGAPLTGHVSWWVVATYPGCPSQRSGIGVFTALPLASFEYAPSAPRAGQPVRFTGRAEGGPASLGWAFGDGGSATGAEPVHVFPDAGAYTVELTVTTASGSHTARRTITVAPAEPETFRETFFVPVVLSIHGAAGSFYTTEMVLTNRGTTPAKAISRYTGQDGTVAAAVEDELPAGRQLVIADAVAHLRARGAVPDGDRLGTLRVTFEGLSAPGVAAVTLRSTTALPDGRAGLAYRGLASSELLHGTAFICGLRQDEVDRSNVAVQNGGLPEDGPITLRLTAVAGDGQRTASLAEPTLAPGAFFQLSNALAVFGPGATGTVRVERIAGAAPFYAYGVINDQITSDGSFVPAVAVADVPISSWILPVAVETPVFTTELVVANLTAGPRTVRLALGPRGAAGEVTLAVPLGGFEQRILRDFIQLLREQGIGTLEPRGATVVAAVFVTDEAGDARGLALGARVSSPGAGGRLGIFAAAVKATDGAADAAWLYGARQDAENRTNVAFVATGGGPSDSTFDLEVFDGDTGQRVLSTTGLAAVAPRGFLQLNGILAQLAPGTTNAYLRVVRTGGSGPFLTYAVINDGARPQERSGDGAFVPGVR